VGFNTPQLAAVKLWQRLEFMVVNPTRTKNFLYKKKYPAALPRGFFITSFNVFGFAIAIASKYAAIRSGSPRPSLPGAASSASTRLRKSGGTFSNPTSKERSQEASEKMPYLGSAEGFKKFVRDVATRNHCFEYEKIVIVSDGATWIRAMCDELFPGSQQIHGYYHLAENIYSFGKYIFSNDEKKYTPWAESLPYLLKNGRTEEALESLRESVHADTSRKIRKRPPGLRCLPPPPQCRLIYPEFGSAPGGGCPVALISILCYHKRNYGVKYENTNGFQ
jgi:hypothetical protein